MISSVVLCHWQTSLMYRKASLPTSFLETSPTSWPRITEVTRSQIASACLWFLKRVVKSKQDSKKGLFTKCLLWSRQPSVHILTQCRGDPHCCHPWWWPPRCLRPRPLLCERGRSRSNDTYGNHIMKHLYIFSILMNRAHLWTVLRVTLGSFGSVNDLTSL